MITVWVLIFIGCGNKECAPAIIDNIVSREECIRVQEIIQQRKHLNVIQCIEVKKK